jgi:hypothetical protein
VITQTPIQWVSTVASLGIKREEREADHSSPCNDEVEKHVEPHTQFPYSFTAWCLIKIKENFTLIIS